MTPSSCQSRFNLAATRPKEAKNFRKKREAVRPEVDQPDRKTRSLLRCLPAAKKEETEYLICIASCLPRSASFFRSAEVCEKRRTTHERAHFLRFGAHASAHRPSLSTGRPCRVRPNENGQRVWLRRVLSVQEFTITFLSLSLSGNHARLPIRLISLAFAPIHLVFI